MANIIAIVWDFDKTLISGYMQDPIFADYGIIPEDFWKEVNAFPEKMKKEQKVRVNPDTAYLNKFIEYARAGKFKGLDNAKLRSYGQKMKFYPGIPDIFKATSDVVERDEKYKEYNIKVEHYIVSTGMTEIIKGSSVMEYVKGVWGCELIESKDSDGDKIINDVGYTIDNTTKTRALFEINKGVGFSDVDIHVNAKIPEENRRVHFINMIYVADGPSDIPAFSVVNQNGGATFAIYPKGDEKALEQVESMRATGRVNMYAEANYTENSTAGMWLKNKVREFADRIREEERGKLAAYSGKGVPKHLV